MISLERLSVTEVLFDRTEPSRVKAGAVGVGPDCESWKSGARRFPTPIGVRNISVSGRTVCPFLKLEIVN